MGRLIDADICLNKAWQNFYKQEDEHEKNIDDYDISRDRFYEQSGFECCQQAIVNAPTVEVIPKADYETRLKADMVALLTEIQLEIKELDGDHTIPDVWSNQASKETWNTTLKLIEEIIEVRINNLKEMAKENNQCPWYDMCIYKTATCRVRYPDEGCVLYRWFKELINNELIKLIDKTYEDFNNAPGGEGWCEIDGKEYQSDMGYAYEGIDMFVDVLKSRMEEEK